MYSTTIVLPRDYERARLQQYIHKLQAARSKTNRATKAWVNYIGAVRIGTDGGGMNTNSSSMAKNVEKIGTSQILSVLESSIGDETKRDHRPTDLSTDWLASIHYNSAVLMVVVVVVNVQLCYEVYLRLSWSNFRDVIFLLFVCLFRIIQLNSDT